MFVAQQASRVFNLHELSGLGLSADVGSAIIGVVTPDEVFLFTDSARLTITPTPGATPELIDTRTMKLWKTQRLGRVHTNEALR